MQYRQATIDDIPALVECRIRQLIDEGREPHMARGLKVGAAGV